MPVRRRHNRSAQGKGITQGARRDLSLSQVRRYIDVRSLQYIDQFIVFDETVDEVHMLFDPQVACHLFQAVAIGFAFLADQVRMCCADHQIDDLRAATDNVGQGGDDRLNPLVGRQQPKRG